MLRVYEVPLATEPQKFSIQLGELSYFMRLTWCIPMGAWCLDIWDGNDVALCMGIPLITGLDLLAPYEYLGITGSLIVQTDFQPDAIPTFTNLGDTGRVYFVTEG